MKNELVKSIFRKNSLLITVFNENLKEIENKNWKWDSLMFASNDCTFVTVQDVNNSRLLRLVTHGDVKILNNSGECLSLKEIENLSSNDYDFSNEEIAENNWFSMDFGHIKNDVFHCEDDYVFDAEPKSIDELIEILVTSFYQYFSQD